MGFLFRDLVSRTSSMSGAWQPGASGVAVSPSGWGVPDHAPGIRLGS